MTVPATQRAREAFDEQNSFLRAVLGLASLLASFDTVLEHHGEPRSLATADADFAGDEQLLDALLGAVHLKARLQALIADQFLGISNEESLETRPRQTTARLMGLLR